MDKEGEEANNVALWDKEGELPCLVCHPCPVINDLWLEGGCKQRAHQLALLRDNLHPTAIFFTKHQLTRPILHYKLGLPDPLGSVCGHSQKSWSDARRKTGRWMSENNAALCGINYKVIVFNSSPEHFTFTRVDISRTPSHTGVSAGWIAAINMNFCSFLSLSFLIACYPCPQQ